MIILRFRTDSDAKELLMKLKRMHKFTKEMIECVEEKHEDELEDEDFEDEESYRDDDDEQMRRGRMRRRSAAYRGRYRRSM